MRAPVIVLTGTELFTVHSLRDSWKDKDKENKIVLSSGLNRVENLQILADMSQQLYLGMPSYYEWARRRSKRLAKKKRKAEEKKKCIENFKSSDYYAEYTKGNPEEMCSYYDKSLIDEFELKWEQKFSYDFKDDVKLPDNKEITHSENLLKTVDGSYTNDSKKINDLGEIQSALKEFHKDKGYYPYKLDQLKPKYLSNIPDSPDNEKYIYTPNGKNVQSYTLSVKLRAPEVFEKDSHIKNEVFTLTEKDSGYYRPQKKISTLGNSGNASQKAQDSRRKSDLRQIATAIMQYSDDNNGNYPENTTALVPNYIAKVPTDPKTGAAYPYAVSASGTEYELNTTLENMDDRDADNDGGNNRNVYEFGDDPGLDLL